MRIEHARTDYWCGGQLGHGLMRLALLGFDTVRMGSTELVIRNGEREKERAWAVNRDGAAHLAVSAEQLSIPLLHASTDYVDR